MSKYIDAEKLTAKLTKMQFDLNAAYRHPQSDNIVRVISLEYDDVISLVTSLQQEQPEVDLEKEVKRYFMDSGYELSSYECYSIAHHFYELGLNAREK